MVVEMVDYHADDSYYHRPELINNVQAGAQGVGVEKFSYSLTITGADRIVSHPAFRAVVPDGSGGLVIVDVAAGTTTFTAGDATNPANSFAQVNSSGTVSAKNGVPTAEPSLLIDDRFDAPMLAMDANAVMLYKVRRPAGQTNVLEANVSGRAIFTDIYRWRSVQGWVAHDAQAPATFGTIPAKAWADIPMIDVHEAFNGNTVNNLEVGTSGTANLLSQQTDVSTLGVKNPYAGSSHGRLASALAVTAVYTNLTGSEPSAGKVSITVPWRFLEPEIA
jgi:hypothetical protein|tara:strand:+ start:5506 stop:6336 length:831 start_codon:yes stop_codon:yes gene_type:complete